MLNVNLLFIYWLLNLRYLIFLSMDNSGSWPILLFLAKYLFLKKEKYQIGEYSMWNCTKRPSLVEIGRHVKKRRRIGL
jgi:hypothetical protein